MFPVSSDLFLLRNLREEEGEGECKLYVYVTRGQRLAPAKSRKAKKKKKKQEKEVKERRQWMQNPEQDREEICKESF